MIVQMSDDTGLQIKFHLSDANIFILNILLFLAKFLRKLQPGLVMTYKQNFLLGWPKWKFD